MQTLLKELLEQKDGKESSRLNYEVEDGFNNGKLRKNWKWLRI